MRVLVLGCAISLAAAGAWAQATGPAVGVPPIEQEPRPGIVQERERALGIAPDAARSRAEQQGVDALYRELLPPNSPQGPAALPGLGNPGQEAREEQQLYRDLTGGSGSRPAR